MMFVRGKPSSTQLLLSVLVVPALSVSGEDGPVIIVIKDLGTKSNQPHRVPAKIPFECHYDSGLGNVVVMFANPIGEVYVDIDNRTTGEHIDVLVSSDAGVQVIPCPGAKGFCTITFSLSNGRQYYGEFNL